MPIPPLSAVSCGAPVPCLRVVAMARFVSGWVCVCAAWVLRTLILFCLVCAPCPCPWVGLMGQAQRGEALNVQGLGPTSQPPALEGMSF